MIAGREEEEPEEGLLMVTEKVMDLPEEETVMVRVEPEKVAETVGLAGRVPSS